MGRAAVPAAPAFAVFRLTRLAANFATQRNEPVLDHHPRGALPLSRWERIQGEGPCSARIFGRAIQCFGSRCALRFSAKLQNSREPCLRPNRLMKQPADDAASRRGQRTFSGVIFEAGDYATLNSGVNFRSLILQNLESRARRALSKVPHLKSSPDGRGEERRQVRYAKLSS